MMTEERAVGLPRPSEDHAMIFNPPKDVSNLAMAICIFGIAPYLIVFPLTLSTIPKTEHKGLIAVGATVCIIHLAYLLVLYTGLKSFRRKNYTSQKLIIFQGAVLGMTADGNALTLPMESLNSTSTRLQEKLDAIKTLKKSLIYLACFTILMSSGWAVLLLYCLTAKSSMINDVATVLGTSTDINGNDTAIEERPGGAQELIWICGVQYATMMLIVVLLIWEIVKLRKYTRFATVAKDVAGYFT